MKNDIRIVRKAEPLNGNRVSNINGTRINRQRNPALSKHERGGADNSPVVDAPKRNSRSGRPIKPTSVLDSRNHVLGTVIDNAREKNVANEKSEHMAGDIKRRRTNAQSYINKRFLYDVTEPPKRSTQQKSLPSNTRSPAALMAVSSANLKRQKFIPARDHHSAVNNDQTTPRNKRGRPLKHNLELNAFTERADNVHRNHTRASGSVRNSRLKCEDLSIANQGNLDAQDSYGGSTGRAVGDYSLLNAQPDSSLQKYADPADMATYSGILLNVFDKGHSPDHGQLCADVGNGPLLRMRDGMSASRMTAASSENVFCQPSETGLVGQSRNQTGGLRVRSPLRQTDAAYFGQQYQLQPVFSTSQQHHTAGDEDRTVDLLSLYSEVHPGCFPSQSQLDSPSLAAGRRTHDVDDGSDEEEELDAVLSSGYLSTRRRHQLYQVSSATVVGGGRSSEPDVLLASDELDEEEDLLSPELSILASCSAVAPGNGVASAPAGITDSLMVAGTETGLAVTSGVLIPQAGGGVAVGGGTATTSSAGGSSRRKSPVRPMQVIRTKSHTVAASAPTATAGGHNGSQKSPSLTGGHLDPSSLILTSSLLKCASPSVPAFCRRRASEEADSSSCDLLEHHQQVDLSKATPVGASVIRLVPGHPPVVQTFPTAPSSTSAVTAVSLPGRQLISTNHSRLPTAGSSASEAGDCGPTAGGLLISTTGAHTSRLLVNSGSSNSTAVTRSAVAAASAGSNGSATAAVAANSTGVGKGTSLLSASTATSCSAASAIAQRRRPTILKRVLPPHLTTSANAAATGLLRPSLDAEFPPPLASQTVASSAAVDVDHHHHQLIGNSTGTTANTTSSTVSPTVTTVAQGSALTKLLQLVTAPLPPSYPSASSSSTSSSSSSSTSNCYAAFSTLSMTASDRLFGRRPAQPTSLVSAGYQHQGTNNSVSNGSAATSVSSDLLVVGNRVDQASSTTASTGGNTFNNTTPYRYAVVRGSADGKRYLVLGNHGVFDRNVTSVNGNTLDSSLLVSSSSDLPGTIGGATGLLPLDPFPMVDMVNSKGITEEENIQEFAPTVTTVAGGSPSSSSTGRTLIRRSKGSKFNNLIVTPLPPVSACTGDVSGATAVT